MLLLYCVTFLLFDISFGWCPDGCGCDDEKLETICFKTDLQVKSIICTDSSSNYLNITGDADNTAPQHPLLNPEAQQVQKC